MPPLPQPTHQSNSSERAVVTHDWSVVFAVDDGEAEWMCVREHDAYAESRALKAQGIDHQIKHVLTTTTIVHGDEDE